MIFFVCFVDCFFQDDELMILYVVEHAISNSERFSQSANLFLKCGGVTIGRREPLFMDFYGLMGAGRESAMGEKGRSANLKTGKSAKTDRAQQEICCWSQQYQKVNRFQTF